MTDKREMVRIKGTEHPYPETIPHVTPAYIIPHSPAWFSRQHQLYRAKPSAGLHPLPILFSTWYSKLGQDREEGAIGNREGAKRESLLGSLTVSGLVLKTLL